MVRGAEVGTAGPKVLYLPNETEAGGENQQVGGRTAFQEMEANGVIRQLTIYSFLSEYYAKGRRAEEARQALLAQVQASQPDIIFWSHPQDYPVTEALLRAIKSCQSRPLLVYHEGDPFDRFYKRVTAAQKLLYRASEVFFTVGLGEGRRLYEEIAPHRRLFYVPSYTEGERFARVAAPDQLGSRYDAVMIGNIAKRLRTFKHPGSKERVRLGLGLARLFGDRFASFGRNWPKGTNNRGSLRHVQQSEVIQSSRMSLMWEHFPNYTFYFSDRLPIALAAGVPFITSTRPGYDTLFPNVPGLFHVATVDDALDVATYLRSLPLERIREMGAGGRAWVLEHLEARVVFRNMFQTCLSAWRERASEPKAPQ